MSRSQSQESGSLSAADLERESNSVVRFILAAHGRGLLKRDDIRKQAVAPQFSRALKQILETAGDKLEEVFGLTLRELDKKGEYIVLNSLRPQPDAAEPHVRLLDADKQKRGLLMIILALIFMNNGSVSADLLWTFLKKLRIEPGTPHVCFGDVKKLVMVELVRQRYLKKTTDDGGRSGDQKVEQLEWGERAHKEVNKMTILEFVSEMWGDDVKPDMWTQQYQQALQEAEED